MVPYLETIGLSVESYAILSECCAVNEVLTNGKTRH